MSSIGPVGSPNPHATPAANEDTPTAVGTDATIDRSGSNPGRTGLVSALGLQALADLSSTAIDPWAMVRAVQSARIDAAIPVVPGRHSARGMAIDIPPGTTFRMNVTVASGRMVANERGDGLFGDKRITGTFDPPLKIGSTWPHVRIPGAYLESDGEFRVDLQPGPDPVVARASLDPAHAIQTVLESPLLAPMLDVDNLKLTVTNAVLKDMVVRLGDVEVDLGANSTVTLSSSPVHATLRGNLDIDHLKLGPGAPRIPVALRIDDAEVNMTTGLLESGQLRATVPTDSIAHELFASVQFAPGTTATIEARAQAGQIVPTDTRVRLSHPATTDVGLQVLGIALDGDDMEAKTASGVALPIAGLQDMPTGATAFLARLTRWAAERLG